jgi:DNA-binding transcriptional MocR family regulator
VKFLAGWIKLHRKYLSWEWFTNPNTQSVFLYLLLSANHKDGKWQGMEVLSGQHITSIEKLSEKTGLTFQQVRTALNKLKSTGEITSKSTNKYTLITVVNWAFYQGDIDESNKQNNMQNNKQITSHQQTNNNQITTNKNDKKDENKNNEENKTQSPPAAVGGEPPSAFIQPVKDELKGKSENRSFSKSILAEKGTVINNHGFGVELNQAIDNWITYKAEKRQAYTPSGQNSLLQQIQENAGQYGDNSVIYAINESMASNYNGIIWDKAKSQAVRNKQQSGNIFLEYAKHLDEQESKLERG